MNTYNNESEQNTQGNKEVDEKASILDSNYYNCSNYRMGVRNIFNNKLT